MKHCITMGQANRHQYSREDYWKGEDEDWDNRMNIGIPQTKGTIQRASRETEPQSPQPAESQVQKFYSRYGYDWREQWLAER